MQANYMTLINPWTSRLNMFNHAWVTRHWRLGRITTHTHAETCQVIGVCLFKGHKCCYESWLCRWQLWWFHGLQSSLPACLTLDDPAILVVHCECITPGLILHSALCVTHTQRDLSVVQMCKCFVCFGVFQAILISGQMTKCSSVLLFPN